MSETAAALNADGSIINFEIRYEGGDAERHALDMMALGESLQGFGRIYSVVGHFATTGQYAKQTQALSVRTYAQNPEAKCFSVAGLIGTASQAGFFDGIAGALIGAIVTYAVSRNSDKSEEMRHLRELLEKQMGQSQHNLDRAMETIERLASGLAPSVKKAVTPVGDSCDRIDLYANGTKHKTIDLADKEAILSSEDGELLDEREYNVLITELDTLLRRCKVHLLGDEIDEEADENGLPPRISADITDPAIQLPGHRYGAAFTSNSSVTIKAKAFLKEGSISKLFISDCK